MTYTGIAKRLLIDKKYVHVYKQRCVNGEITKCMVRKLNILMATAGTEHMERKKAEVQLLDLPQMLSRKAHEQGIEQLLL